MAAATAIALGTKLAPSIFSSAMAFQQAADSNRMVEKARKESERLMEEAKKKIEINRMEGLTLPNVAYARQSDDLNQSTAQAIQGLQESGDVRAIIGGTQGVQSANADATQEMREDMSDRLTDINKSKLEEQRDIDQQMAAVDVAQAQDQAQISADAEVARANATKGIVSSLGSLATGIASSANLFSNPKLGENVIANSKNPEYIAALKKRGISVSEYLDDPEGIMEKISGDMSLETNLPDAPAPSVFSEASDPLTDADLPYNDMSAEGGFEIDEIDPINTKQVMSQLAPEKYAQMYNKGRKVVRKTDRRIPAETAPFNGLFSVNDAINNNPYKRRGLLSRLKRFGLKN